jgi:hypothetical protein
MLKRLFRGNPPKYELPPLYIEGAVKAENLPSYEQLFTGPVCEKNTSSPRLVRSKEDIGVSKAIAMLTSGELHHLRLDKTTISPMAVLRYFVDHGKNSHKDVYLLRVVTEPNTVDKISIDGKIQVFSKEDTRQHTFYLVSHKATLGFCLNLSKITSEFCYRTICSKDTWAVSTNFLAFGHEEQKKSIKYISSLF